MFEIFKLKKGSCLEKTIVEKEKIDLVKHVQKEFRVYAEKEDLVNIDLVLHRAVLDDLMDMSTDMNMPVEKIIEVLITTFSGYTVDTKNRLVNVSPVSNKHLHNEV